jgi:hypothetical protein
MPDEPTNDIPVGGDENLADLTDEQLDSALEGVEPGTEEEGINLDQELKIGDDADDEEDEAKDKDEDADEDADDASDDESDEAEEEEEEEEEQDDHDEDDEIPAGLRSKLEGVLERVEMLEAERDKLSADLERERLLRDRNAGKLGALMQQLKASSDSDAGDDADDLGDDDSESRSKPEKAGEKALAEIRAEKVNRAINEASGDFYTQNQEFFATLHKELGEEAAGKFQADLVAKVREHQSSMGEDLYGMSAKTAQKVATSLITSAFADLKMQTIRDLRKQATEADLEDKKKIRARKKNAAGTRSKKSGKGAVSKTKTKSLSQMSDAELDAALAEVSFED